MSTVAAPAAIVAMSAPATPCYICGKKGVLHYYLIKGAYICEECGGNPLLSRLLSPTPELQKVADKANKCECGSDAVGSPRHSHWCKKYEKE